MAEIDDKFFDRADEHINLSNEQLETTSRGKVSASMMYSVARFNAWVSACGFNNAQEMEEAKDVTVQYFVKEFEKMLIENLDNYIEHFDKYIKGEN